MKQVTLLISACVLGISIIISSVVISETSTKTTGNKVKDSSSIATNTNSNLMTKKQLSQYLQVSQQEIDTIITKDNSEKAQLGNGVFDTYQFLPYLKIGDQERFLKTEVDKWLKYKSDRYQK